MESLTQPATLNTPEVLFDFDGHTFELRGESHPEDVISFYQPLLDALETYLNQDDDAPVTFIFNFIYFNSSTAKIVMTIMDMLDSVAEGGRSATVRWMHDAEDDNMAELGEDFGEDLVHATFELEPHSA